MPELPEVESMRLMLEPKAIGRTLVSVTMNRPEIVEHPDPTTFASSCEGCSIMSMGRRGKFISIDLDSGDSIWFHLRMTGRMYSVSSDEPVSKHTHIIFHLDDGTDLRFTDPRRFGRFWLLRDGEEDTFTGMSDLGPEPMGGEITRLYLEGRVGHSRRCIKSCLLDQSVIAGIGNIYADEILFLAGIRPTRKAETLETGDWERISELIPKVLGKGLEDDLRSPEWYLSDREGDWDESPYLMYGHGGDPCPTCGMTIERTTISNRSSYFCPNCQR